MQALISKAIEQNLGLLLKVRPENVEVSLANGCLRLREAELRSEVLDNLYLPFTLRGGFLEEVSLTLSASHLWSGSGAGAQVLIKNVSLLFGPNITTWDWASIVEAKRRLTELLSRGLAMAPPEDNAPKAAPGEGFMGALIQRGQDRVAKMIFNMLEVSIANIHVRYDDSQTQVKPFSCGLKIGSIHTNTAPKEKPSHDMFARVGQHITDANRPTGNWKHAMGNYAKLLLSQDISCRRISAYWDTGKAMFLPGPIVGEEVRRKFARMNVREIFSTSVVETLSKEGFIDRDLKFASGPTWRERYDYHRFLLYPTSIEVRLAANCLTPAVIHEQAPLLDLSAEIEKLEVAIDTNQLRSITNLAFYFFDWQKQDKLLRTRPHMSIAECLRRRSDSDAAGVGNMSATLSDPVTNFQEHHTQRTAVIRAWWRHAFKGVLYLCGLSKNLKSEDLRNKSAKDDRYASLCVEDLYARSSCSLEVDNIAEELKELQAAMSLGDIISAKKNALKVFRQQPRYRPAPVAHKDSNVSNTVSSQVSMSLGAPSFEIPESLQVSVNIEKISAYFLVSADLTESKRATLLSRRDRQLALRADIQDLDTQMVQRGQSSGRLARWIECTISTVSAWNMQDMKLPPSMRSVLRLSPLDPLEGTLRQREVCLFFAATTYEINSHEKKPTDIPLSAVLSPGIGLRAHLEPRRHKETDEQLNRLGFIARHKDEVGRLLITAFGRVGVAHSGLHMPFARRMVELLQLGQEGLLRPSLMRPRTPVSLHKEIMRQIQQKVEAIVGISNMMSAIDIDIEGVRARLFEDYNKSSLLCKEVDVAPSSLRFVTRGRPQGFELQVRRHGEGQDTATMRRATTSLSTMSSIELLPWRVTLRLLDREGYDARRCDDFRPKTSLAKQRELFSWKRRTSPGRQMASITVRELRGRIFRKWGRNGKKRERYVVFDEDLDAIAWKANEKSKTYLGAIPLGKLQDVCLGLQTPVFRKVGEAHVQSKCCFSIVASYRTLDLEADSEEIANMWVSELSWRYRRLTVGVSAAAVVEPVASTLSKAAAAATALPKALERRSKHYPAAFRPARGELCSLKSTCLKLQALSSFARALDDVDATAPKPCKESL